MSQTGIPTASQRPIALALIVFDGLISLPVAAALLDGESTDQLIIPVQLVVVAVLGAMVGALLPGLAGAGASRARGAAVGAVVGLVAALLSIALFALLLGGI